jgi:DNA polymerase-3 subunit beta
MAIFVSEPKVLVQLLSNADKYISSRPDKPVLGTLLIEVFHQSGEIVLRATGGTRAQMFSAQCNVLQSLKSPIDEDDSYKFCVAPKRIIDVLSSFPSGSSVEFDLDSVMGDESGNGRFLSLKCGKGKYKVESVDPSDFLEFVNGFVPDEVAESDPLTTLDGSAFCRALSATKYAMSKDETKLVLCGVRVELNPDGNSNDNGTIELAATNGHRLAFTKRDNVTSGVEGKCDFNIPESVVKQIESTLMCGSDTEIIELKLQESVCLMTSHEAGTTLAFRAVEGQFPRYRQLVPKTFSNKVLVNSSEIASSLVRISPFVLERNNIVKFQLNEGSDGLTIFSPGSQDSNDYGEDEISVGAGTEWDGDPFPVAINHRYFSEGLATAAIAAPDKSLEIRINTATSPMVVAANQDNPDIVEEVHLLMPIQIRS